MQYLADQVASGIAIGSIYGLVALAFALIFKASGIVNFAQGEMTMLVGYIAYTLSDRMPGSTWAVVALSLVGALFLGLLIERLIMRPMIGEPLFATVMCTVGLALLIRSMVGLIWDPFPHVLELPAGRDVIDVAGVALRTAQLGAIVTLLVAMAACWAFLRYHRLGKAMRAVAADPEAAALMGISTARIHSMAWAISAVIAGMAGIFFSLLYDVTPAVFTVGMKAFPASILGGLDSPLGSAFGGVVVGIVENLASGYIAPSAKEIAGFVIIIIVLMVRPFGLFGERDIERV